MLILELRQEENNDDTATDITNGKNTHGRTVSESTVQKSDIIGEHYWFEDEVFLATTEIHLGLNVKSFKLNWNPQIYL